MVIPLVDTITVQAESGEKQAPAAIVVDQLSFDYGDRPQVLQNLSITITPGQRVGIIGHNGSGKTTFFLLLSGVLSPSVGSIQLFGKPLRPGQFRPEVGLLFQDPDDQLFSPSVQDDIAFGPQNMGLPPSEVQARVTEAAAITGITHLLDRLPHHLSGGEKQMVAIAGLLAMAPKILLCDEPTASLDLRARRRLIQLLQQSPQTLLLASHDLEFILEVGDRVLVMDQGRLVADGPPRQIMGNQQLMENHGLEKPHSLTHHQH